MEEALLVSDNSYLSEWLNTRARLNHDLLINRIRNVLGALVRDASNCEDELSLIRVWISRQDEYRQFFRLALDVLSTAHSFDEGLPARTVCQENLLHWREWSNSLFLARSEMDRKIIDLEMRLQEAIALAAQLLREESVEQRKAVAANLFASTERLSAGISALPSKADSNRDATF